MKALFLPCVLLLLLIIACHPDPAELPGNPPPPAEKIYPADTLPNLGHLNYNALQIGQQNRYVHFYMPSVISHTDTIINYLPDTLITVVTGQDPEGFVVKEYYTRGSAIRNDTAVFHYFADTIYTYHLRIVDDSLRVIKPIVNGCYCNGSQIYALIFPLPLLPIPGPKIDFWGWHSPYTSSLYYSTAYVENQTHWGQNFDRLNIVFDNSDVNGLYYAYSATDGLVRFSHYSLEFTTDGDGWDLLPE